METPMMRKVCCIATAAWLSLVPGLASARSAIAPYDPQKAKQAALIADPEEATRAYLDSVPAERQAKTKAFAEGNYLLQIIGFEFSALFLLAFLGLGLSARLRDWTQRLTRLRPLQAGAFGVVFILCFTAVQFPFVFYQSYLREKQFDQLTQDLSGWLWDQAIGLALGCVMIAFLLMVLYGVLQRAPGTWWLWGWLVTMAFLIFVLAVVPVYVAPLFNKFTSLPESPIRERILALARERGIPAHDVFVMDASKRTTNIGAYVAGLFGTTRIVLADTLMQRGEPDQIVMITGHEMGHYLLNHVWKGVGVLAGVTLVLFLLFRWFFNRLVAAWPTAGITGIADPAGLPLLWLLATTFLFLLLPLWNAGSRYIEAEADNFGLEVTHLPDAAATSFLMLGEYRDLDPDPVIEFVFFDHPSGKNRIHNAMEWKKAHAANAPSR
jgi:STE24 endopeptidase